MPSIPSPTPHTVLFAPHLIPAITLRAQPSPTETQVVVNLTTVIIIPDFSRFYPSTSPDSFQPVYYTFADGSLVAPPLLDDLRTNHIFLIITGCLLAIFLRNVFMSAIYLWRGKVKKKGLLCTLFLSQLLGPITIVPIIVSQFDRSANCAVILRIASAASGVSLSLLLTGILGIKVYRCLDNNRFVLAGLVVLFTATTIVLILDVINLPSLRSLSGRCCRPSAGLSSVFVMILLTESVFIWACFLYVVWKSHGPVSVRGRISVHLSLDDDTLSQPTGPRKEVAHSSRHRKGSPDRSPTNRILTSPQTHHTPSLSREPSIASIRHDQPQRMHTRNTPANAETTPNTNCSIPFPSTVHSHTPRSCTVRVPTTTDGPHLPPRAATPFKRPTSPMHSSLSHFTRYIPRMSLFREVMRDELCYMAAITAFTVVSVAMTLVGVKSAGGIDTTIWVILDWALVSLLVMHSFGRVIRRHENESLLFHSSAWYHDLHTDRTTAELLRDIPQPVRTPRVLFRARARRSVPRYDRNGGASPSDLSTCRLFPGSAYSSRGDLHSLAASTSGTSNTFSPVETESFIRAHTGGPHVVDEGRVRSTTSMEDLSLGPSRSQKPPGEWLDKNLFGTPSPLETADEGHSFGVYMYRSHLAST